MYLTFSDAAKFADIARNLVNGLGYGSLFNFWGNNIFDLLKNNLFPYPWTPPVMPYSIALFYKIFGVNDFAVIATSFFYFVLTLVFVFLVSKKLFKSNLVGFLTTLAVGFNYDLIDYATKGASESPFIFGIVASIYFVSLKKKWADGVAIGFMVMLYFTRSQAFIYLAGIILFWLLINYKFKKALIYFAAVTIVGILFDYYVLRQISGKFFLYSITDRLLSTSFNQSSTASDSLRGAVTTEITGTGQTLKNVFYNLYNFYKAIPDILNPYLFGLFTLELFLSSKTKAITAFKLSSLFIVLLTLLLTAASIPFYRYIHPIIPLVYIIAAGTLVEIISKLQILNQTFVILTSLFIVLFFGVGQTLGILLLDSRFEKNTYNVGKPPVYVELSIILKESTKSTDIVLTNLDTWGSWYGERKTVWFPLQPKQITDPASGLIPFDAIYLTSYKADDPNYLMGEDWKKIFENPNDTDKWTCEGCSQIAKEFELKEVFKVDPGVNYEGQEASAVLLIKK